MYQDRNRASIFKQFTAQYHNGMRGVKLTAGDYRDMDIPRGSLLYLDPPYANTSAYKSSAGSINKFDHPAFYRWCVSQVKDNECSVFCRSIRSRITVHGIRFGSRSSLITCTRVVVLSRSM